MTNMTPTPKKPDAEPTIGIEPKDQPRPKDEEICDEKTENEKKGMTIRMAPSMIATLDELMKSRGFKSRSAFFVALIQRELEDPMDAHAEQIGVLNAWMFKLFNPDSAQPFTKAERTELEIEFRRAVDHIVDCQTV